jgi:hypothetical protein
MPIFRTSPRRSIAMALTAAMLFASCSPPAPTASPSTAPITPGPTNPTTSQAPAAEVYAAIRRAVEAIRGLEPAADVDPVTIDAEQLKKNLAAEFDAENTAADLEVSEQTLITLGLLPKGTSLRQITLDFQGGQVAGYYSPDKKELYVVSRSGRVGAAEKVTYAHEFTHQLQDQNFPLLGLLGQGASETDGSLAALAVIEGDAVSVQTTWTVQNLTPEELGELLQASLDPEALEALRRAPAYLRETALFPYQDGMAFVQALLANGYAAVNDALGKPPTSTEQVIHPEKYVQGEAPLKITLPKNLATRMGPGWSEAGQDTLGELVLRIWLTENGIPTATATAAAAGWGGDRLMLLRGPSGEPTVALMTRWDSEADATAFASAAATAGKHLGGDRAMSTLRDGTSVVLTFGPDAIELDALLNPDVVLTQ